MLKETAYVWFIKAKTCLWVQVDTVEQQKIWETHFMLSAQN